MKLQCIECGRRIDKMSRNTWRWFNVAQTIIICNKHIMLAKRNGSDDPRLNEIQDNEAESIPNEEMNSNDFRINEIKADQTEMIGHGKMDSGQNDVENMEYDQVDMGNDCQSEFEVDINDNEEENASYIDDREYYNSDESEEDKKSDENNSDEDEECDIDSENDDYNDEQEQEILLNFKRLPFSKAQCFLCKKKFNRDNRSKTISIDGIVSVLKKKQIVIKIGSRCCPHHLTHKRCIKPTDLDDLEASIKTVKMKKSEIESILSNINSKDVTLFEKFLDTVSLSENFCKKITGLTVEQFNILKLILEETKSMRISTNRSIGQALAVYLFWLKTGLDQDSIAIFFGLTSRLIVQRCCSQVCENLNKHFVPLHLGANSRTREQFLENNSLLAKKILGLKDDELVLIADGTYLYCQKSFNNTIQRLLFSGQKKRHLVKPFIICLANGYIIDAYGMYGGTNSDSDIIKHILKTQSDLKSLLKPKDVLILDRGFERAVKELQKDHKLIIKMPTCTRNRQLTNIEANQTRIATKLRWAIEAINGIFKKNFKAVEKTSNNRLKKIIKDFRIAAAIINCFHKRLYSDKGNEKEIVEEMMKKINKRNELEKLVVEKKYKLKKSEFIELNSTEICDFPRLSLDTIKMNITLGSYQIKMSKSYLAEHLKPNGKYTIHIKKDFQVYQNFKILMCIIQSRHSNAKKYYLFIKYNIFSDRDPIKDNQDKENEKEACENLRACSCFSGLRTAGCCVHVATVVMFLSYYRFLENPTSAPGKTLESFLIDIDVRSDLSDLESKTGSHSDSEEESNLVTQEEDIKNQNSFQTRSQRYNHRR